LKETNTMSPNDSNGILARMHASRRAHRRTTAVFVVSVVALSLALGLASRYARQPREFHVPPAVCGQPHVPAQEAAAIAVRP
jgi:hypothetical protein